MKKLIVLTLLLYIAIPSQSFSQQPIENEREEAIYQGHKALVETQKFQFVASWVFQDRERKEVPSDLNTLQINPSEVKGLLVAFSTDQAAIALNGQPNDYSTQFKDKEREMTIQFKTGLYQVTITITSNGNAFLSLKADHLQTVSYKGRIVKY